MSLPMMKLSPQIVALRIRENQIDVLQKILDDIVVNFNYPANTPELLQCIQASLTKRQGGIPADTAEHINIQRDVDGLQVLIDSISYRHEA